MEMLVVMEVAEGVWLMPLSCTLWKWSLSRCTGPSAVSTTTHLSETARMEGHIRTSVGPFSTTIVRFASALYLSCPEASWPAFPVLL